MINKNYFSNVTSKNILREPQKKTLSENISNIYVENSLTNMLLNSNLDDENIIK